MTPDTLLGWYRRFVAQTYDRRRPRRTDDIVELVLRMANENKGARLKVHLGWHTVLSQPLAADNLMQHGAGKVSDWYILLTG